MNSDPYRTRSMASLSSGMPAHDPPMNNYGQASANAFRQQAPPQNIMSRTTAQGRIVPERHDERAMSLNSFSLERDHSQTMSGRVIPNRKRDSGPEYATAEFSASNQVTPSNSVRDPRIASPTTNPPSRTMSMASTIVPPSERTTSLKNKPSIQGMNPTTSSAVISAQYRSPLVYPALLSRVAAVFQEKIRTGDLIKNGLTYTMAFTGSDAVDTVAFVIKTTDRNLALLLGRALDAQKFYHDVTYEHRLRDSENEIFQFRDSPLEETTVDVNGVFTLLTECYSPTCTKDRLCYSIACPRRLEQQARLNLRPQPGLRRQASTTSLHEDQGTEVKLWVNSVPDSVAKSVSKEEQTRQEIISEIAYTERDFVKDLEYLRDFWVVPLKNSSIRRPSPIPEHKRLKFVKTVFSNSEEVREVSSEFARALTARQQESPVVDTIGDLFLRFIPRFDPFITYGAGQIQGRSEFEFEKTINPGFARWVDEVERLPQSRKLELNGYLTKPTTRLGRYPLLLRALEKATSDDNMDKQYIPKAIDAINEYLKRVNEETGKAETRHSLVQLQRNLEWPPGERHHDLKLLEEGREILFKGGLKKAANDSSEIEIFLFNHALLMVRKKVANKKEKLKVYRPPVPLELLVVVQMDEFVPKMGISKRPSSSLIGVKAAQVMPKQPVGQKDTYPITFKYLGRHGFEQTLFAPNHITRQKWIEHIHSAQLNIQARGNFYKQTVLCDNFFSSAHKVNCLVPIDGGRKLVYGTDSGIYVSSRRPGAPDSKPRRVLDCINVTQIDTLEEYQLLLVLSNKALLSYPLEVLETTDSQSQLLKRPKKIQNHANFFEAGVCMGRHLVCSAKMSGMSTTIKVYEPADTILKKKNKSNLAKVFQNSSETLKPYKEFYVPAESTSIDFLRSKLCVACAKGFEVVSLDTAETQPLLDAADTSLDFVTRKDNIPISIERLNGEFLLHYTDYSFFVNRNGWRARNEWVIAWEGRPTAFALSHPYLLAFEPQFIEIRHLETAQLVHIITGKNMRMLHSSTSEVSFFFLLLASFFPFG